MKKFPSSQTQLGLPAFGPRQNCDTCLLHKVLSSAVNGRRSRLEGVRTPKPGQPRFGLADGGVVPFHYLFTIAPQKPTQWKLCQDQALPRWAVRVGE